MTIAWPVVWMIVPLTSRSGLDAKATA